MSSYQADLFCIGFVFDDNLLYPSLYYLGKNMCGFFQIEWHYMCAALRDLIESLLIRFIRGMNSDCCKQRKSRKVR